MGRRLVDNTAKTDVLTVCDTSGTLDIELTRSGARDARTHRVGDASVQIGYQVTATSGEDEAEEDIYMHAPTWFIKKKIGKRDQHRHLGGGGVIKDLMWELN